MGRSHHTRTRLRLAPPLRRWRSLVGGRCYTHTGLSLPAETPAAAPMTPDFFHALTTHFWRPDTPYVLAMAALIAIVLLRRRAADRQTLTNTLGLFLGSYAGQLIAALVLLAGVARAAETLHEIFVITAGLAVIRLWGLLIFRVILPLFRMTPPHILEDILITVAYLAWGLLRLRYAGLDLSGIVATSAVITAVLAFSMQDTLGNILGGIALQLDNSISLGDWIKVDDVVGKVVDIRWRFTAIETRNWETVVVPNSQLMKNKFTVLGRREGQPVQWRRWVWFNVEFAIPPTKVLRTVESALRAASIPNVSGAPAPNCVLMDFDRGYGRYAARYWLTDLVADDPTDSAVRTHIYTALLRAGIQIAVPQYDLHMTKEGEKYAQAVRTRESAQRLAALKSVDLFRDFTAEELQTLAERLVYAPFTAGELITRQGSVADWLYLLTTGEADVYLEKPGRTRRLVNTLGRGSIFGEMGLMTGEPRTATIVARTDVETYRLEKAAFGDILHSRPTLAEEISRILAARREALSNAQHDLDAERPRQRVEPESLEILARIQRFFGLD